MSARMELSKGQLLSAVENGNSSTVLSNTVASVDTSNTEVLRDPCPGRNFGIYNSTGSSETFSIEVVYGGSTVLTENFSLKGLNSSDSVGIDDAGFRGNLVIPTSSSGEGELRAETGSGKTASCPVPFDNGGIAEHARIHVTLDLDGTFEAAYTVY